jgi:hypothetical protein
MATQAAFADKPREAKEFDVNVAVHRRVLNFFNQAVEPDDLAYEKVPPPNPELDPFHEDNPEERKLKRKKILDVEVAKRIIELRDQEYPLGFRHLREVIALKVLDRRWWEILLHYFSESFFGSWSVFPQPIPRRGPGGYDGVVHAALLHTGQIVYFSGDEHDPVPRGGSLGERATGQQRFVVRVRVEGDHGLRSGGG